MIASCNFCCIQKNAESITVQLNWFPQGEAAWITSSKGEEAEHCVPPRLHLYPFTSEEVFTSNMEPTRRFLGIILFNFKMYFSADSAKNHFLRVHGSQVKVTASSVSVLYLRYGWRGSSESQCTSLRLGSVVPGLNLIVWEIGLVTRASILLICIIGII